MCPDIAAARPGALSSDSLPFLRNVILLGDRQNESMFAWSDVFAMAREVPAGKLAEVEQPTLVSRIVEEMHCPEITIGYGMTEASPLITQTTMDDSMELRLTTVGRPLPHTEVKIADALTKEIVEYGDKVAAWIKAEQGCTIAAEEVVEFCRGRIAAFKIPSHVKIVSEFPTAVTGKIQKFRIREMAAHELKQQEMTVAQTA